MIEGISRNVWGNFRKCLATSPEMFCGMFEDIPRMLGDIPQNVWWYSLECLATFSGIFEGIPRDFWRHSAEHLRTFARMFVDILWDVWGHSQKFLVTFPGMLGNIPRNITFLPTLPAFPAFRFPFQYSRLYT